MKTIKTQRISAENFDSIYEFLDALEKRELNSVFRTRPSEGDAKTDGNGAWRGTDTWAESVELMSKGYIEGVRKIRDAKVAVNTDGKVTRSRLGVVGYAPHVPNAIVGIPTNMLEQKRVVGKVKEINIFYDRGATHHVSIDTIAKTARMLLDVVNELEVHGVRVGLYAGVAVTARGKSTRRNPRPASTNHAMFVKIKDPRQPINLMKMAYPLVHPSFFRRQCLCWEETTPIMTDRKFLKGHGATFESFLWNLDERRNFMVSNGVIGKNDAYFDYCGLREDNLDTPAKILQAVHKQLGVKL